MLRQYYYCVNNDPESGGEHEVHREDCRVLPSSCLPLGLHYGCDSAVRAARKYYDDVDGCWHCSRACHTR